MPRNPTKLKPGGPSGGLRRLCPTALRKPPGRYSQEVAGDSSRRRTMPGQRQPSTVDTVPKTTAVPATSNPGNALAGASPTETKLPSRVLRGTSWRREKRSEPSGGTAGPLPLSGTRRRTGRRPWTGGPAVPGITQQQLESRLWEAANSLRGPVDPADFKAYVFPLLFFKWISDTWDLEHAEAVADYGPQVSAEEEADYHRFVVPAGCRWADVASSTTNVGRKLRLTLGRIEQANPTTLAGVFGNVDWADKDRLPEANLVNLLNTFTPLILNRSVVPNDMLGAAYEYLLRQFAEASGRKAGEFFTPPAVVHLLVAILDPQPGESVYDPACGSAGILVETINAVARAGGDTRTLRLYGQEVNLTTSAIARMNLFFHDLEDFRIVRGDTLRDPKLLTPSGALLRHAVQATNPPFSLKNWGADTWASDPYGRVVCKVPPAGNGDFAWIQHILASMEPKVGRAGVVMPHGVLFRGSVEAEIRECVVKQDQLEAVIGLPPNLFYSTAIPACLLIFRAQKVAERRGSVLFLDASRQFQKGRNQNEMSQADIAAIVSAYRSAHSATPDGVKVRLVSHAEIKECGWDLNVGRYVATEASGDVDVAQTLAELRAAQGRLREAEERLQACLRAVGYE